MKSVTLTKEQMADIDSAFNSTPELKKIRSLVKNQASQINASLKAQGGSVAVEYALLVALIAFVAAGGMTLFGAAASKLFADLATSLGGVVTTIAVD